MAYLFVALLLLLFAAGAGAQAPVVSLTFDDALSFNINAADGGVFNVVSGAAWTQNGRNGGGLLLLGNGASLSGSPNVPVGDSPYTISLWILRYPSCSSNGLLGWGACQSTGRVTEFRLNCNQLDVYWWDNDLLSGDVVLTNIWQHVATTWDGTHRRIFVNGVIVAEDSPGLHVSVSGNFAVGRTCDGDASFNGIMDDVYIFSEALSISEIGNLAASTSTSTASPSSTASSTASLSPTITPGLSCPRSLFRGLARTDLVGAPLSDAPLAITSENACRIACCGAPGCDGYAFAFTELRFGDASCFLLANVTSTTPANAMASGLRVGVALPSAPASASPAGTPLPAGGWPQRGGSVTATPSGSPPLSPPSPAPSPSFIPIVEVIAGTGVAGYGGDGGLATLALLQEPCLVSVTPAGDILFGDQANNRIRKVTRATGIISTVAGNGQAREGDMPPGTPATSAFLRYPTMAIGDGQGNIVIADNHNHCVRRVDTTGIISTVAGVCGSAGLSNNDAGLATSKLLYYPGTLLWARSGSLLVGDEVNGVIREVNLTMGVMTTFAGRSFFDLGLWATGSGCVSAGDGGLAIDARICGLLLGAYDPAGNLWIGSESSHYVRKIDAATGVITAAAGTPGVCGHSGDGLAALSATLCYPMSIAFSSVGDAFIRVTGSTDTWWLSGQVSIRRISAQTGIISSLQVNVGRGEGNAVFDASGRLIVVAQGSHQVYRVTIDEPMPSSSASPSPVPYCASNLFRTIPRMDLVGTLAGTALTPGAPSLVASTEACRQACCDAPYCDGFSFASGDASFISGGIAGCFLYVNITQLIPSSGYSSGIYESTL